MKVCQVFLLGTILPITTLASVGSETKKSHLPAGAEAYLEIPDREEARQAHQRKTQLLAETGARLYLAIVKKDISTILSLVDDDGGLSSQIRPMVYKDEVTSDLKSGKGHFYCHLFGCKNSTSTNIQSELKKIPRDELAIDVQYLAEGDWAGVTYSRAVGRAPASSPEFYEGDYQRPLLTFRYKNGSWKIFTLFEK